MIFGRASFPASFNLASLNGSNGFTVNGAAANDFLAAIRWTGPATSTATASTTSLIGGHRRRRSRREPERGAAYVIFGKTTAPSRPSSKSPRSTAPTASPCAASRVGQCRRERSGAGDVNSDGYDDVIIGAANADPNGVTDAGQSYVVYGRPSFAASLDLASLLAANGGDGSAGFVINGFLAGQNTRPAGHRRHQRRRLRRPPRRGRDRRPERADRQRPGLHRLRQALPAAATKFYVVNDAQRRPDLRVRRHRQLRRELRPQQRQHRPARRRQHGRRRQPSGSSTRTRRSTSTTPAAASSAPGPPAAWPRNATVEGIATNGTDVWIVDAKQDKVFRYTNAAGLLSGSQNAASSFSLNSGNANPKDIVTDGTSLWVVNDSTTDKVFKYTLSGSLLGSWTITGAGTSPTGITLDPTGGGNLWIVDSGTDRVYQFDNAAGLTSGSHSPSTSFALAAGNTNPQGIADPPVPTSGASQAATSPRPPTPRAIWPRTTAGPSRGLRASKSTASSLPSTAAPPSILGRQETPILIPLTPSTDQDLTLVAAELLRAGTKRSRSMLARTQA